MMRRGMASQKRPLSEVAQPVINSNGAAFHVKEQSSRYKYAY